MYFKLCATSNGFNMFSKRSCSHYPVLYVVVRNFCAGLRLDMSQMSPLVTGNHMIAANFVPTVSYNDEKYEIAEEYVRDVSYSDGKLRVRGVIRNQMSCTVMRCCENI